MRADNCSAVTSRNLLPEISYQHERQTNIDVMRSIITHKENVKFLEYFSEGPSKND
jgi:hypothetical protein